MKKGVDLIYKLNGNIDEGIDVIELSPILLSFGKLINEAHKTLFPNEPEIAVNIKPFQKGSFEISLWMFAKDVVQHVLSYINSDTGKSITAVLICLGLIAQISGVNLLEVISFLKGKKLKSIEPLESGECRYNADDNSAITVPKEVNALYLNYHIQQNIYNGVAKPLELPNIESIHSFVKNDEDKTKVTINKDMAQPIRDYSISQIPVSEQEEIVENTISIWVHPVKANLEGGPRSWSFRTGKDETIIANISDEIFLTKIRNSEIRLASADRLFVELLQRQIIKGADITKINEITKIKEYVKEPEQVKIKFD